MAGPLPQIPRVFAWETAHPFDPDCRRPAGCGRATEPPRAGPSSLGSASDLTTWRPFFFLLGGWGVGGNASDFTKLGLFQLVVTVSVYTLVEGFLCMIALFFWRVRQNLSIEFDR